MATEEYAIGPLVNNIDFYTSDEGTDVSSSIGILASVSASAVTIKSASSSINVNISSNFSASKIFAVESSIDISANLTCDSFPLSDILAVLYIQSNVSVEQPLKIAYASSSIDINSNIESTAIAKRNAKSQPNIASSATFSATRVVDIQSNQSINVTLSVIFKKFVIGNSSLSILSGLLIPDPIKFSVEGPDLSLIRTLLMIDDKPITEHNRVFDSAIENIIIENTNWQNRKSRYYSRNDKSGREVFNISWTMLPNDRNYTVDKKFGRDYLYEIANDGDTHTLKIIKNDDFSGNAYTVSEHEVFISSYSETLIRRDLKNNVYYFNCTINLEES